MKYRNHHQTEQLLTNYTNTFLGPRKGKPYPTKTSENEQNDLLVSQVTFIAKQLISTNSLPLQHTIKIKLKSSGPMDQICQNSDNFLLF